jgi:hypothetical protein
MLNFLNFLEFQRCSRVPPSAPSAEDPVAPADWETTDWSSDSDGPLGGEAGLAGGIWRLRVPREPLGEVTTGAPRGDATWGEAGVVRAEEGDAGFSCA